MACEFNYKGKWYTEDQLRILFSTVESGGLTKSSPTVIKKVREFLDRIDVNVKNVEEITVNGNKLGINGLTDALNGLILVANGKESVALTEEAMHMAVELLEQKNPTLFKEMMNKIGSTNTFTKVVTDYRGIEQYQNRDGKPDIPKLKKEAIGKVLANIFIRNNEDVNEKKDFLSQLGIWWQKVLDFLKSLFLQANFNPFEEFATQIAEGTENLGTVRDLEERGKFFQTPQNEAVVNANLKLLQSLRNPKASTWFNNLYQRGQKGVFLSKLQSGLQAPKQQVEMLKAWLEENNPETLDDMIAGVLAEMTYAIEIQVSQYPVNDSEFDFDKEFQFVFEGSTYERKKSEETGEIQSFKDNELTLDGIIMQVYNKHLVQIGEREGRPSYHHEESSVSGGVNYRENEIKTPNIIPSIKGHAEFATDKGIGWFRSDDKATSGRISTKVQEIFDARRNNEISENEYNEVILNLEREGYSLDTSHIETDKKTRRILELQSDLFQKGRDRDSLVNEARINLDELRWDMTGKSQKQYEEEYRKRVRREESIKESNFLQLLNKDNAWVTFFIKAIIQDSAKKNYEKVRFPGGSTANKIEGQQTVEEFIKSRENRLNELREKIWVIEAKDKSGRRGRYKSFEEAEKDFNETINPFLIENRDKFQIVELDNSIEIQQIEREIKDAQEGRNKFSAIANFYETTVQNILKKQGYKPTETTDEYNNKWFEIDIKKDRDLGEFYFQLSSTPSDIVSKLTEINNNLAKTGETYNLNGEKVRNTVDDKVEKFYKGKHVNVDKFTNEEKSKIEQDVKVDIRDILSRLIDDNHELRTSPLPQTTPSASDPYDNSFYNTLDDHFKERLNAYAPGTKFFNSINVYDEKTRTAGSVDLLVVMPDNKIDILQFKLPQIAFGAKDVSFIRQGAYNTEIEALRNILQSGYGVKREQFDKTRAVPMRATYKYNIPGNKTSGLTLDSLSIGNVNVQLIKDDVLIPIPSSSETTNNDKFDTLISRLRGLVQKLSEERVSPEKRLEKSQRLASLTASIRKLQVQKNTEGVLSSARTIVKRQQERYGTLTDKLEKTDPEIVTIQQLNDIAADIMDEKDQVELYVDLYRVFKEVFTDGTDESKKVLSDARGVSDNAQDIMDDYWKMYIDFRKTKLAAKVGIVDDFNPEKQLTMYRRMIRSLSQSSLKAGAELWELVKRINNLFQFRFQDRLKDLWKIEERVQDWLKGKTLQDLYKKIFQFDARGNWNGRVIQKYSKDFYEGVRKAQEHHDLKWIKSNIDVTAYNAWFLEEHKKRVADSKNARVHEDDAENKKRILASLTEFVNTFSLSTTKGVNQSNYKLKDYPKEDRWKSKEYQELERKENEPVLDLYNYWRGILEESLDSGMIQEHNGWSWFPNVRRNLLEKLSTAKAGGKLASFFGGLRLEAEDDVFGKIDPLTGKPIDEIHANFVSDLGQWVEDVNGKYFLDYSEKSMDIFKVLALWNREIIQFQLRTESEALARMLAYTEREKQAFQTSRGGKLKKDSSGKPILISNDVNAQYIKDHIDAVYYGKSLEEESDVTIDVPYKSAVERINKIFGKEILDVPEEENITLSGKKAISAMNRFFVTKTLGLNVMTSVAQLFGGTINTFINQGKFFNKKDILEAEAEYVSGRFWASEQNKKMAGLLGYIHPFAEDRTSQQIRNLSVSAWIRTLSSDHLFYLQRGSDNWVNSIIAMSLIKNTMLDNGKLINIREYAKKELGHSNKYQGTYEDVKDFNRKLEMRVDELKNSPQALINIVQIINDQIVIPGVDRESSTLIAFRQQILELIKNALGNTSREDLSLYKRSVIWQSFFMFKNWIPRMFDVRGGSLKFNPGTQQYEWGRARMLFNAVRHLGLSSANSLLKLLGNNEKNIIEIAKISYQEKQEQMASQNEDFTMSEAEFIDMYIKGVRSELKEILLALGLFGILIAARLAVPDRDENPEVKGAYRWMLKGLDKLTDEVIFFYSPKSFTDIVNGSIFPSVGMLVDIQKFFTVGIEKLFYLTIGDEKSAEAKKMSKYLFKVLPITKELMTYIAIFNDDMAKEYGIRLSAQNGSIR